MARGLASADYLELEMLPAYQRFVTLWNIRRQDFIKKLAYSATMADSERAEFVGRLKEIDEVLAWVDEQLGRSKVISD